VPLVVALVAAAADALAFAHGRGIIHRDIKPANLMRVGDRAVKVMDFGLAKNATTSMTHDGALLGTPNYMSPEQVRGDSLDGRTDLFSLGVVCYEMLTGAKPFGGDSISSVLYRIVHEPPKDASFRLERVPPSLATFLERALAKNPEARFPDGAAFSTALRRVGASVGVGGVRPVSPGARPPASSAQRTARAAASPSPAPRSPVSRIVAIALGVTFLGAAMAWLYWSFVPPRVALLEARVRTEPSGLPVRFNGAPLEGEVVRFGGGGPFGVLTAAQGCREAKHRVEAADAGGEIVLVLDPERVEVAVDPGVPEARLTVNGREAAAAPATIELDLCRDNMIEVVAEGYRTGTATIPAKATPLDARTTAGAIRLEAIPTGRLVLPATRVSARFLVDGNPTERTSGGIDLPAGTHEVRAINEERFIDVAVTLDVPAGGTATPELVFPALARIVVQTFPPNCRVAVKRSGSAWRPVGETPLRYELAAGRYLLRVESPVSGESREQDVALAPGTNAPIRVSFGRSGR
jgi:hypothetical protein